MIVVLYFTIGLIACFSALVLLKIYNAKDEILLVIYPLFMFFLWPIVGVATIVVLGVKQMDKFATVVANNFIENHKK